MKRNNFFPQKISLALAQHEIEGDKNVLSFNIWHLTRKSIQAIIF
jgi:hypothetical protein